MKVNDLRVGNLVISNCANSTNDVRVIESIQRVTTERGIFEYVWLEYKKDKKIQVYLPNIIGVTLTEEILLKFGFIQDGILFEKEKNAKFAIKKWVVGQSIEWMIFWGEYHLAEVELKHAHKLQNIYYELTGKELEYHE